MQAAVDEYNRSYGKDTTEQQAKEQIYESKAGQRNEMLKFDGKKVTFRMKNIFGGITELEFPLGQTLKVKFNDIFMVAYNDSDRPPSKMVGENVVYKVPYEKWESNGRPNGCCITVAWTKQKEDANTDPDLNPSLGEIEGKKEQWDQTWDNSGLLQLLESHLRTHAKSMRNVDKVLCIGLGRVGSTMKKPRYPEERSYFQHRAACTIADIIAEVQKQISIDVYAQDPQYTDVAKEFFKKHMGQVKVVEGVDGLLSIDKHTFIVTCGAGLPVIDMAVGLVGDDGPAGAFCDIMYYNFETLYKEVSKSQLQELKFEGNGKDNNQRGRHDFHSAWATDRMWEWKQKCEQIPSWTTRAFSTNIQVIHGTMRVPPWKCYLQRNKLCSRLRGKLPCI
jgi:hypothetical protein